MKREDQAQLESKIEELTIRFKHLENDLILTKKESGVANRRYLKTLNNLQKKNRELELLKDQLEAKVLERTSMLIQANNALKEEIERHKKTVEQLKEAEERYRNIFENAQEGIFQVSRDGRCLIANPSLARIHGYDSPEELIKAITNIDRQLYVDRKVFIEVMALLKRDGIVNNFEAELYKKDGSTNWVSMNIRVVRDDTGDVLYYEGTVQDITERKRAENALKASEEKYRSVVEGSLAAFYITQDLELKYVNRRFCEMHGYTYEEMVGKLTILDVVYPEDREKVKRQIEERIKGMVKDVEYESRGIRKDGSVINLKVMGSTLMYNGRPAAIGTIIDITKEKALEAQLYQAQKLEAIEALAGGIAHDFNNILSAIIGYVGLLQMKMRRDDPLRLYLEQILSSSHKATQLIQGLLSFSRKQTIRLFPYKINSIIEGVEKILRRLLTEDIELVLHLSDEDLTVMADTIQLDQLFANLVTNARDAMPEGGVITIKTSSFEMDNDFIASKGYGEPGRYVLISISDTGHGMDDKLKARIFEPFFTTKGVGKGTGLGLSMVYGIVTQHNGYIDCYSEPGRGTRFDIYLPVVLEDEREDEKKKDIKPRTKEQARTSILVAEDNEELRKLIKIVLKENGYDVIEASNGLEAIDNFKKNKDKIGLAVLDVVMPGKNGKEVYDEIKKIAPNIKVLFTSGYTDDILHHKGLLEEGLHLLPKPVAPETLLKKVREMLDNHIG